MAHNCSSCGCNSGCNNHNSCHSRRCGALRHIGCDSCSRCASATATTCSGSPLYYEGPCPCAQNACGGCNNCGSCNCGCNNHHLCAAEFASYAPQTCCAGGALSFTECACHGGGFSQCHGGVRVENPGMYILTYTFSAPQGMNAASDLCLVCGGVPIHASGAYIAPVIGPGSRTASGQALVELRAGDVVSLVSSTAMDICDCGRHTPVATLILRRIG